MAPTEIPDFGGDLRPGETAYDIGGTTVAVRAARGGEEEQSLQVLGQVRVVDEDGGTVRELRPRNVNVHKDGIAAGRVDLDEVAQEVQQDALQHARRQLAARGKIDALPDAADGRRGGS